MIDISAETPISFSEACKLLPRRRRGRKPSPSTLWRWAKHGLRGIKLETIVVGGQRMTSAEALQRFFDCLTESTGTHPADATSRRRKSRAERAERELGKAGI